MAKKINHICNEIFSKLLACENIDVIHSAGIDTAMFVPDKRQLILPIFKGITEVMYDLFVSHECGHAIFTPAIEKDVFHPFGEDNSKNQFFQFCLNVLEDVRVEKLLKRKFLGISKFFYRGYGELSDFNFFKTKEIDVNARHFLDRANLHFKLSLVNKLAVEFNDDELNDVALISATETFNDVYTLAQKLFEKYYDPDYKHPNSGQGSKKKVKIKRASGQSGDRCSSEAAECESEDLIDCEIESDEESSGEPVVESCPDIDDVGYTERAATQSLKKLIDRAATTQYINIPTDIDVGALVVDYKKIHSNISEHYASAGEFTAFASTKMNEFKRNNNPIISYLIKEFEMRKSADIYSRIAIAKTGVVNTDKLHQASYCDDIFLRKTIIPEGKNHGLVMFIDCSGSMATHMADTIEQMMILVMFCRKANIKFEVYGFFAAGSHVRISSAEENDFYVGTTSLHNYFSTRMSAKEFSDACQNMMALAISYRQRGDDQHFPGPYTSPPGCERLSSSTTLNECAVVAAEIINSFRKKYQLQRVNAVFLSDGESNTDQVYNSHGRLDSVFASKVILRKKGAKREFSSDNKLTPVFFRYLSHHCGCNVLGFFITTNVADATSLEKINSVISSRTESEFLRTKSVTIEDFFGYDALYVVSPKRLKIVDRNAVVNSGQTNRQLAQEFSHELRGRLVNRILLNNFINRIA